MVTKIVIVAVVVLVLALLASGYVKAPTDTAFIISGLKKEPKVLIGRAGIKIPFLERKDWITLKQISIDIKTNGFIPTKDFIGVDIDAIAKVRMLTKKDISEERGITAEMVNAAMKNFLNMDEDLIKEALTDSLQGNMREIIGTQTLKELCQDRKAFGDEVQSKAQKDMNALGIWIESCNIQKITDENDLINALGQDNMAQIKKDASIAKANADRDVAIAEAEAKKISNDAEVAASLDIAQKKNDLAIKQAELKKISDIKQAEADAAYEIQKQEQRKTIEINKTNADIARSEKEAELKEKEAAVRERELDAQIKKQADAEKYAAQQRADAELYKRQKAAEAELAEQQRKAEALKAKAEAEATARKAAAEAEKFAKVQEAEAIKAKGLAEAEATKAKGEAEARAVEALGLAEAEAIDKKAEAYAKMEDAAKMNMQLETIKEISKVLPEVASAIASPLTQVGNITMYGDGNVSKITGEITKTATGLMSAVTDSFGIDAKKLIADKLIAKKEETDFTEV